MANQRRPIDPATGEQRETASEDRTRKFRETAEDGVVTRVKVRKRSSDHWRLF